MLPRRNIYNKIVIGLDSVISYHGNISVLKINRGKRSILIFMSSKILNRLEDTIVSAYEAHMINKLTESLLKTKPIDIIDLLKTSTEILFIGRL